jgi:hypothetical protein
MFQFKRDFNEIYCGARNVEVARGLNPTLQTFDESALDTQCGVVRNTNRNRTLVTDWQAGSDFPASKKKLLNMIFLICVLPPSMLIVETVRCVRIAI